MAHQNRTNTLPLVFVDHGERQLGLSRGDNDITATADDDRPAVFFPHCDQGNVIDKIDIDEERGFLLAKLALHSEETAIERFRADAADRRDEIVPVFRSKGTNLDPAPVSISEYLAKSFTSDALLGTASWRRI